MLLTIAGGRRAEVTREGDGPALVLVHSLLTDAHAFDLVAPALARGAAVYRVSLPGFGASPPLRGDGGATSIDDLADYVAAAMDAAGVGPEATVCGNGLGGFVVAALAIRHGERVRGLIPANCGAAFPADRRGAFETMSRLVEKGGMKAVVDVAVRRIFPAAYLRRHPQAIEERRAALVRVDPGAFAAAARALARMDLRPRLGAVRTPTLVLGGGADETTPASMAEELAAGIAGAQLAIIPGCGHCPPLEQPAAFLAAVDPFLAGLRAG